ncbi:DUF1232 domain-containing protein [Bacillus sp. B15-48]|uniref:helix-turn-helix domain-containing protein n=1 Tax=Bacillus sp. B15-48 TaxID=1548601 RepID=UPI00193F6D62|nr:DUF1232 domain-containing protein [Bacillus sp. B15-48]MBM4762888.1 helix-turn-helix domain-containing protein [Bacillus sp. B15-48]
MLILSQQDTLGTLLKELLEERSLSMGKFSVMCQVDKATISRIVNGKRKANLSHLQKFADSLDVSINELMHAAGYHVERKAEKIAFEEQASIEMNAILESTNLFGEKLSVEEIKQELAKYEQYAQTEEGRESIHNDFKEKLKKVDSIGPYINHLQEMYERFRMRKGTTKELALTGAALLYFILTIDLIPDYIFPIGYLDDAMAIQLVLNIFKK